MSFINIEFVASLYNENVYLLPTGPDHTTGASVVSWVLKGRLHPSSGRSLSSKAIPRVHRRAHQGKSVLGRPSSFLPSNVEEGTSGSGS